MVTSKGFEKPNHTQTPNSFFDESLKHITSLPELKVVLAIIRKTLGWQKEKDRISMSQIRELTGMKQQSVKRGIDLALEHGFIEREPTGQHFVYSLKLVTPCDQSHLVTSHTALPEVVTPCDQNQSHLVTNKRKIKEKKETPAFAVLMKHHADRVGKILNGGRQGKAINAILSAGISVEDAIAGYEWVSTWSDAPDWAVVQGKIGSWLAKRRGNGSGQRLTPEELKARDEERLKKGGWDKLEHGTA